MTHVPMMVFKNIPQIQNLLWSLLWISTGLLAVSFWMAQTLIELPLFPTIPNTSHLLSSLPLENSKPYNHPWFLCFPSITHPILSKNLNGYVFNHNLESVQLLLCLFKKPLSNAILFPMQVTLIICQMCCLFLMALLPAAIPNPAAKEIPLHLMSVLVNHLLQISSGLQTCSG